jgi:hypothetical protein
MRSEDVGASREPAKYVQHAEGHRAREPSEPEQVRVDRRSEITV